MYKFYVAIYCSRIYWCYGNVSTRKQTEKSVCVCFILFSRIIGNPSKTETDFCCIYIWFISLCLGAFPLCQFQVFIKSVFYRFCLLLAPYPLFCVRFRFSRKSFIFSVCWMVSSFLGSFPLFLGLFPVFRKSFKFSVCCWVSSFLVFRKSSKFSVCCWVSSFFRVHSVFFYSHDSLKL